MSLIIFGIHLVLLGCLIYRSGYIPKILGILLVIDGLGWRSIACRTTSIPTRIWGFSSSPFWGNWSSCSGS